MIYNAEIIKIDFQDEYEGRVLLKCNGKELLVAHQLPPATNKYFVPGKTILVDLWLFYGSPKHSLFTEKQLVESSDVVGGVLRGQVTAVFNSREFRIDCGAVEIDILHEQPLEFSKNEYVEVSGCYYIFLPNTEYSKEEWWG